MAAKKKAPALVEVARSQPSPPAFVRALAVSPDGARVIVADGPRNDGRLIELHAGEIGERSLSAPIDRIAFQGGCALAYSDDEVRVLGPQPAQRTHFAVAGKNGVRVLSTDAKGTTRTLAGMAGQPAALTVDVAHDFVAAAVHGKGDVHVWQLSTGKRLHTLKTKLRPIEWRLAFVGDGSLLAGATDEDEDAGATVFGWTVNGKLALRHSLGKGYAGVVAELGDGAGVAFAYRDRIAIVDVGGGSVRRAQLPRGWRACGAARGAVLATKDKWRALALFDIDGAMLGVDDAPWRHAALSDDGMTLAVAGNAGIVRVLRRAPSVDGP